VLEGDTYKPGAYPKIAKEIEPLQAAIRNLKSSKDIVNAEAPVQGEEPSEYYQLKLKRAELEHKLSLLTTIDDACKACERYLSSEYQRVSPLLGAFEALGVDPSNHSDPEYKYEPIAQKLLEKWREVADKRNMVKMLNSEAWDERELDSAYEVVRSMHRAWNAFPVPVIPGNVVARGDIAENLANNYKELDVSKLEAGEHSSTFALLWPGPMSTTIGDTKTHSYTSDKTLLWNFTVTSPCPGRVIGNINPAEQEITFPIGVKVKVNKLVVSRESSEGGAKVKVLAYADLG
jgi:hypothetical protein